MLLRASLSLCGKSYGRFMSTTGQNAKFLLFGSGMVAGPFVDYLSKTKNKNVTIATLFEEEGKALCGSNPNLNVRKFDVASESLDSVLKIVGEHDVIVSFLPAPMHPTIAKACIQKRKNMVTASYISPEMAKLNDSAKENGVTILNEIGLDPGIDHVSAMQIIDDIKDKGGKVTTFISWCGGLPAPEVSDNALGYRFSWSPRGVLTAGLNSAKFKMDGKEISIDGKDLFKNVDILPVETPHRGYNLEGLPNRDSLPYGKIYNIESADTIFRGTLRFKGFSKVLHAMSTLGLLNVSTLPSNTPCSWGEYLNFVLGADTPNVETTLAMKLKILFDSHEDQLCVFNSFKSLGLMSLANVDLARGTYLDVLCAHLEKELPLEKGNRDLVLMHHIIKAEFPNKKELRTSTLIAYGEGHGIGPTAMARTVGIPAAIAADLLSEGKIKETGVIAPMSPEIYNPVLKALKEQGIECVEKIHVI